MPEALARLNDALSDRYHVARQLGEGGMATVYLAEDLKHRREVAIKVLRPELAAMVGAERFLAEIEVTANLQHPHILALYDSGEADGLLYYVMPYVAGETLRERLDRERQLPVDEALRIAKAVASGLDYAHRQGVVHRDIKPANILLQDGQPLLADFGIALAVQEAGGGRLTETGLSLGTPYYMSPEQATSEQDPGPRSDVYSLGCVLFEMLTGDPPFTGSTAQAVLGKILTSEPPLITGQRKTVPPHVDAVIQRALQKVPADRFGSAAEFAKSLDDPGSTALRTPAAGPAAGTGRSDLPSWLPWGVAAVAVAALGWSWLAPGAAVEAREDDAGVMRAVMELPENASVALEGTVAISDQGDLVVVNARNAGEMQLLQRRMDAMEFEPVAGTDDAQGAFLSPDGRWVAFRVEGRGLWRVPLAGGPAEVMDERGEWAPGEWADDGTIYYSRSYSSGLWKIPPGGGGPEELTRPREGELAHWNPSLLPDGEHLLFTAFRVPLEETLISVLSLATGERKDIHSGGIHPHYVPTGHILYVAGEAIYAVPFDPDALEVTGDAVPVVQDVAMAVVNGQAAFAVSDDGTLVYVPASDLNAPSELVWVDRQGREEPATAEPARYENVALSPDGARVAGAITAPGGNQDIWVLDLDRGTRQRVTSYPGSDFNPVWTPSGDRLVYSSERPAFELYTRLVDQSAPASILVADGIDKYAGSFVPGGDTLVYQLYGSEGIGAWKVPLAGGESVPVLQADFDVRAPIVSPDGRWLAYSSRASGQDQVYLSPYAMPEEGRVQVSVDGGTSQRWTRNGRELVYRDGDRMLAVQVDPATGSLGRPQVLFEESYEYASQTRNYDVTPDGERFLMVKRPSDRQPRRVVVVTNFFQELRARFDEDR